MLSVDTIFPRHRTNIPTTMGDHVVILILPKVGFPYVRVLTHREICDANPDLAGIEFENPVEEDFHLQAYIPILEEELGSEADIYDYWTDRHFLALEVKHRRESENIEDNAVADLLAQYMEILPVYEIRFKIEPFLERMLSKRCPEKNLFRIESAPTTEAEADYINTALAEQGLTGKNTCTVVSAALASGPIFHVHVLYSEYPNGESEIGLYFSDEQVIIPLGEKLAQLVVRFLRNDPVDCLNVFELNEVQRVFHDAVRRVQERQHPKPT